VTQAQHLRHAGPPDPAGCDMVCNATPLGMAEGDRIADYVLSHIGWFLSYEVTEGAILRTRFCFETTEHAAVFRAYLRWQAGSRSAA
jgi:hypothetical protein